MLKEKDVRVVKVKQYNSTTKHVVLVHNQPVAVTRGADTALAINSYLLGYDVKLNDGRILKKLDAIKAESSKSMSNADRIRNMSDAELAEWLTNMCDTERHEEPYKSIYNLDTEQEEEIHDSYGDLLNWLQSDSKKEIMESSLPV